MSAPRVKSSGPARRRFDLDLTAAAAAGQRIPCGRWIDGEAPWTSDDVTARQAAAVLCRHCPVRVGCLAVAKEERASFGVWGGIDRTPLKVTNPKE